MNTNRRFVLIAVCFGCLAAGAPTGCRRAEQPKPAIQASPVPAAPKLGKIVFVGKEHACDCTRKAVDASWAADGKGTVLEQLQGEVSETQVLPILAKLQ